jgi:hypothetical protein
MAFGDYSGPDKPNKGREGGACNRSRCQAEPALHYNHGSYSWYCADCARDIGDDAVNRRGWAQDFFPRLGHPQFETRAEMDARKAAKPPELPNIDDKIQELVAPYFYQSPGRQKPQSLSLERMLKRARRRA